jgi:aspartyl-tRNA(Asn)/glutamyl-tRNA(Gln) amidotransferase subunit A
VPAAGVFPLSTTLDSIGPLASTVADCAVLDASLAAEALSNLVETPLGKLRFAAPQTVVLDELEPAVAQAFERALMALRKAGARVDDIPLRELAEIPKLNAKGGLSAAEAYATHRALIAQKEKMYDPRVLTRILGGEKQSAADYVDLVRARAGLIARVATITGEYDALVMPTVPVVAPRVADCEGEEPYRRLNALVLRNPSLFNFLDRCAISIPCHRAGEAPVGLMLAGEAGADRRLLAMAAAVEELVSPAIIG